MFKVNPKLQKYFKGFSYSAEIIVVSLYPKFRFSLSYRDVEELSELRGLNIDHSTIQRWVEKFASLLDSRFRRRKKDVSSSWRMDESVP